MNAALLTAGLVVCVISLVIFGIKAAQKGGERRGRDRERADRLAEGAERAARAQNKMAMPLPDDAADAWDEYVDERMPEDTKGS